MKTLYDLELFLAKHGAHATIAQDKGTWKVMALKGYDQLCAGFGKTLPAACEDMMFDLRTRERGGK